MRLRKQLLFLSLVTLALPWVGCQYIREMDAALRQGQTDSLTATARAVAARLASDRALAGQLAHYAKIPQPLYAHSLKAPIYIDGYNDDWISQGLVGAALPGAKAPAAGILLAIDKSSLLVFLQVTTASIRYFRPTQTSLDGSDHFVIYAGDHTYAVFAGAPGRLKAIRVDGQKRIDDKAVEHQIKGFWLEWAQGYQAEFSLPLAWTSAGLALRVATGAAPTRANAATPRPLLARADNLARELEVFASERIRLHLVNDGGYLLASSGGIALTPADKRRHGFLEWLYGLALGNREFPPLSTSPAGGRLQTDAVDAARRGQAAQNWYRLGAQNIAQVSLPIRGGGDAILGAVVAEQSEEALTGVTTDAFGRLLAYSFLASTFAALCLVAYATWLSLRIRTLSAAAAHAVSESGKISEDFPVSDSGDELGELSRSYAQLLVRLREYTSYLRTLSSKLSHELRTPLAIVRSSLDNLEHEKLGQQARTYAERAREGTTRLSNILNSMSAASRVEQAIGAAEREVIPCDELLANLKEAYEDVYRHVNFQLNIRADPRGLDITGSGELLVQAFDKLVDNAADFCPDSGLIELGLYRHQDHVIFTVRNEGPPLPSHMHGQLFDSMVSVRDKSAAEQGHHLGLGLYIVRLITDFHHGEVHGYNVPDNSGVIFEVRLPARE